MNDPGKPRPASRDGAADSVTAGRHRAAVITGASSGVGRALALQFAATHSPVVLIGRARERLEAVAHEVHSQGTEAQIELADFASRPSVAELAARLEKRLPAISVLLHSAAEYAGEPVATTSPEALERVLDVNLHAPFVLTRALLPALEAGSGDIVFINSSVVGQRRAGLSAYGASKAGLLALADSLRQEVNPLGLRVLSVFLGATATPMQAQIHARAAQPYHPEMLLQPSDIAQIVHAALMLSRSAEVTNLHLRPATPPLSRRAAG